MRPVVASCLILVGLWTPRAFADAQQCVVQSNSGLLLRRDGHLTAARDAYKACIDQRDCPAVVRTECEAALQDLKAAMPTLVLTVVDSQSRTLSDALLQLDGESIRIGSALEIDPGTHDLVAAHEGKLTRSLKIAVTEGESKSVEVVMEDSEPPAPAAEPPKPVSRVFPATPAQLVPAPEGAQPEYEQPSKLSAILLGGVGVVGLSSFAYFGLSGDSLRHQLYQCKPDCDPDQVRRVRSDYLVADVSAGLAVLAFSAAGYLLFSGRQRPVEARGASVELISIPRGSALGIRWTE